MTSNFLAITDQGLRGRRRFLMPDDRAEDLRKLAGAWVLHHHAVVRICPRKSKGDLPLPESLGDLIYFPIRLFTQILTATQCSMITFR